MKALDKLRQLFANVRTAIAVSTANPLIQLIVECVLIFAAGVLVTLACIGIAHAADPAQQYREQVIREAQFRFGVPAPAPIIAGQIKQESGWNPSARSPVGAQGLMQFMPATARWANTSEKWGSVDPLNAAWAIRAGVWYDRWLYERITADTDCDRWQFALSAYNGGLGYVYKRQHRSEASGSYARTAPINPGITAASQRENEAYAPSIVANQARYASWGRPPC